MTLMQTRMAEGVIDRGSPLFDCKTVVVAPDGFGIVADPDLLVGVDPITTRLVDTLNATAELDREATFDVLDHEWPKILAELPYFDEADLPVAVVSNTVIAVFGADTAFGVDYACEGGPKICNFRVYGRWTGHAVVAALWAARLANLRAAYPGSWVPCSISDVRKARDWNEKKSRFVVKATGFKRGPIPFDTKFYTINEELLMKTNLSNPPKRALRVAVIGGDNRTTDAIWPDDVSVRTYDGSNTSVKRVADSIQAGGIDRVIVLTKWMGHSLWESLRKNKAVPVTPWPRGIPELARELPGLLDLERPSAALVSTDAPARRRIDSAEWRETVLRQFVSPFEVITAIGMAEVVLGLSAEYREAIKEALDYHVEEGTLERRNTPENVLGYCLVAAPAPLQLVPEPEKPHHRSTAAMDAARAKLPADWRDAKKSEERFKWAKDRFHENPDLSIEEVRAMLRAEFGIAMPEPKARAAKREVFVENNDRFAWLEARVRENLNMTLEEARELVTAKFGEFMSGSKFYDIKREVKISLGLPVPSKGQPKSEAPEAKAAPRTAAKGEAVEESVLAAAQLLRESIPNLATFTLSVDEKGQAGYSYTVREIQIIEKKGSGVL